MDSLFSTFFDGEDQANACYTGKLPMTIKKKRKSPNGKATNDLVFSAYQGTSMSVLPAR
jgi:hypothetical protein